MFNNFQLGWSPDPRLSTGSVPRRSPRPSVLIRQFSEKAGARTRSIRRSLRRRSLKVKTSKTPSDDVTDKKKNRRRFSESGKGLSVNDVTNILRIVDSPLFFLPYKTLWFIFIGLIFVFFT